MCRSSLGATVPARFEDVSSPGGGRGRGFLRRQSPWVYGWGPSHRRLSSVLVSAAVVVVTQGDLMTDAAPFRAFTGMAPVPYFPVMGASENTGWIDEQRSWHETCYVGDWSFVPQIRVKGPDALRLFRDLSVNDFVKFPVGKAKHVIQCNDNGKVISEGILLRHGDDDFEYQVGTPQWTMYNAHRGGY